jgi:hypothetical protein
METMDSMDSSVPYSVHSKDTIDTIDARGHNGLFLRFSYTEEGAGSLFRSWLRLL